MLINILYTIYKIGFHNAHNYLTGLSSYNTLTIPYLKYLEWEVFGI